ncbi:MAG: hypothetical protein R3E04_10915 [Sphingobium sp.]
MFGHAPKLTQNVTYSMQTGPIWERVGRQSLWQVSGTAASVREAETYRPVVRKRDALSTNDNLKFAAKEKLVMDFWCNMRLCVGMDHHTELALTLLSIAGGMLEDTAALAPVSDEINLAQRMVAINSSIGKAQQLVVAAQVVFEQKDVFGSSG